jgi:PAS domain S-box-containing protein
MSRPLENVLSLTGVNNKKPFVFDSFQQGTGVENRKRFLAFPWKVRFFFRVCYTSKAMGTLGKNCRDIVLDSINDGVFTVDRDRRITYFNRAAERITRVPREESIGRRCWEVFRTSLCEKDCALLQTIETGRPIVNKMVHIESSGNGKRIPVSISTALLYDGDGEAIGGVETFRDLSQVEELRKELRSRFTFSDIIGKSPAMQKLFGILPIVAPTDSTVLIEGPSGTGKELVARAIHDLSPRKHKRFVAINCGALPDTLLESELFGHKAGAFTDARIDKPGRFALADGGTIFLDEIGDISPAMQVRLLRVLQEKTFEPLGSVESVRSDVRVVVASNRDLGRMTQTGKLREDLYYRINVIRIELPALCDRREDIPLLIDHFVEKFNLRSDKKISGLSEESMQAMLEHDYPGNVRELENIVEHAFVLCQGDRIQADHLPSYLQRICIVGEIKSCQTLRDMERMAIANALRKHGGNRSGAARELGINASTLFRKIRSLEIQPSARDGRHRRKIE